jgi:hypothetical protein
MFGFGKKNKAKVKVTTHKGGGPVKRLRIAIGTGVVVSVLHLIFGEAYPDDTYKAAADLIIGLIDSGVALWALYQHKPAVQAAADASEPEDVEAVKAAAGIKQ